MSQSLAFDQAVSYYDKTRALPHWVSHAVTESIIDLGHIARESRSLEIGIGTGRIAVPLLQRGVSVTGVDLSLAMMAELQSKNANHNLRAALAQADANALPFPDATFDCAVAVHVFHLVANWQHAVQEAWRVVKRGGILLITYHRRDPQSANVRIRRRLSEKAKERSIDARRPGAQSYDELRAEFDKLGKTRLVEIARWVERTISIAQILDEINARLTSDTWMIPEDVLNQMMPSLREWANANFGSLEYLVKEEETFTWMVVNKD